MTDMTIIGKTVFQTADYCRGWEPDKKTTCISLDKYNPLLVDHFFGHRSDAGYRLLVDNKEVGGFVYLPETNEIIVSDSLLNDLKFYLDTKAQGFGNGEL